MDTTKPDKKTDPIAWLAWFTEKQREGVVRGNKNRDNQSESIKKGWQTRKNKKP